MVQQDVRQGILYFKIQHESYSAPGLTIMLNFNIYKCGKRPLCGCEGTYVPRLNFKMLSINSFTFLHFCIQPIVNCVCCHLVFCHCFKARLLIRILPYQSLQKVGYFNTTVKMLTCKEVLIPVGLIFSYSRIEYVVARLRQHTETFGIQ